MTRIAAKLTVAERKWLLYTMINSFFIGVMAVWSFGIFIPWAISIYPELIHDTLFDIKNLTSYQIVVMYVLIFVMMILRHSEKLLLRALSFDGMK